MVAAAVIIPSSALPPLRSTATADWDASASRARHAVCGADRMDHCCALLTQGGDDRRDQPVLREALALRIEAGAYDDQVVARHDGHVLALATGGGERARRHARHLVEQPELCAVAVLSGLRRPCRRRRPGELHPTLG